jgi:two-component system sensor histidine kinase MtrB
VSRISRPRFKGFGLRTRITLAFAVGGLLLSSILAMTTLTLTRQNLLDQRDESAFAVVTANGLRVQNALPADGVDDVVARQIVLAIGQRGGSFPLLQFGSDWASSDPLVFNGDSVPDTLLVLVDSGTPGRVRTTVPGGPALITGIPIPERDAAYYEATLLTDVEDTMDALAFIIFGAGAATTLLAAALGSWAARRTLKPLAQVRAASESLAAGELDTRLEPPADADLASLSQTFNEMAGALEGRIERDARFASEVSHELRSPLMTLTAALEVLETNSSDLSERGRTALGLLKTEIARFNQLVADLLEISRYDVGTASLQPDLLDLVEFVRQAVAFSSNGEVEVLPGKSAEGTIISADKRRLGQVIANLVDNASKYGEPPITVTIEKNEDHVVLLVEDHGQGVTPDERPVIFDRFSRGRAGGRRSHETGTGLGLALVAEHVGLHGGTVWVEDRRDGESGACFVVELPYEGGHA